MNTPELSPTHWHAVVGRYQTPERWRSLWQAANSIIPFVTLWYLMYRSLAVSYWLTLVLSIPTAGFMIRTFIIFHDCGHGSFFKSRKGNDIMGFLAGILTLTPYYEWRHTHAVHHATAGDLDRRGIGDVLTLTIEEYKVLPWSKKVGYRTMRNPLIMFTIGSFLVFTVAHRFWHPGSGKREIWSVIWTDLALAGIFIGMSLSIGWKAFVLVETPVVFIATAVGVWLFYVQHNFDRTYWERHAQWEFFSAGLNGSSFYKLPGILQWFTGNIGFHHIHHISPKIPNYKLPQCYQENRIFQIQPLTIRSSLQSLSYRLWDEERKILVGFKALDQVPKRLDPA